jgi:hypothetical protein
MGKRIGRLLLFSLLAFACFFVGMSHLRAQHSGVPARVAIFDCTEAGGTRASLGRSPAESCVGHPSGGGDDDIKVIGAGWSDINHDINVHMASRYLAYKDTSDWKIVLVMLGMGLLFGIGIVVNVVSMVKLVRRRRSRTQTGTDLPTGSSSDSTGAAGA